MSGVPSTGVLHAAGIADKGLLIELDEARVQNLHAPKASGAWYLQCATACAPLEARVLFASVGSGLGNVGQANYSASNACLDANALALRTHGCAASSLQWPLVGGAGMGAAAFGSFAAQKVAIAGMASVSLEEYAACLDSQLKAGVGVALSVQMVHRASVHEFLQDLADSSQARFCELVAAGKAAPPSVPAAAAEPTTAPAKAGNALAELSLIHI